jgi:hypothetical protein
MNMRYIAAGGAIGAALLSLLAAYAGYALMK